MRNNIFKRSLALFLALVCVMGILPLSAYAADATPPASITQISSDYVTINGKYVRYRAASDAINSIGLPYVFNEQVNIPGYGPGRALCAYQLGTLGSGANGQKWNFEQEVTHPSLVSVLTFVYSCTNGTYTDEGKAIGMGAWNEPWANLWFMVAQAMSWLHEHGALIDYNVDRDGFLNQLAAEFLAAYRMYHDVYGWSTWITDWNSVTVNTIIDSADNGATGKTSLDIAKESMNLVWNFPQYFMKYRLWIYDWDKSQPWMISGQMGTPMQKLLVAVPVVEVTPPPVIETVQLTVKKLEAGTNQPLAGATFKIEGINNDFSATKTTGADGTITLTKEKDNLIAGQYRITEVSAPAGYTIQNASQVVTVLPNDSAGSVFTFYNVKESTPDPDPEPSPDPSPSPSPTPSVGTGSIRKVDADNPTVGIPGAVIKLTSVKLDDGGSFTSTYTTGDGGYISKEDLDFSKLPTGSYIAEEITPPEGYILSSDVSKVKQAFTWDGEHDVSLIFENSSKVKVQLKKVDESGSPLAGAIFVILRDGKVIETKETDAAGTITVSNVSEGYFEFREVSAPAGYDCDHTPVGVHVNAEDLQGEQTITVEKVNHKLRTLTIQKRDAESGSPVANTSFHIRGVNLAYENDVVTGTDGKVALSEMASGCYEITETKVPSPYILDTENRKTVWIDASQGKDIVVDFVNSTKPGLRLIKTDYETETPIEGVTFKVEQVDGGYSAQHRTDKDGLIVLDGLTPGAYVVTEVAPATGYVADPIPRTVLLEANKTTTVEIANVRRPDLRILKYDQQTKKPLANVTFEVYHDAKLIGQYTTDSNGEIFLSGLEPGTYLVKEVATDDAHVVNSTPQQIELKAGQTGTAELVFFNQLKPGIHLVKVDSVTMKSLPNVRFEVKKVGGSYRQEFTTDQNGEIDLSKLEPGAYEVRELEAPDGYLIDDAVRVVQINPDENANFVFTNTPKPSFRLIKVSADGSRLAGVHFRIAKIEDGTHYLDRITDEKGEINISDLEPGVYSVKETATTSDHILDVREYHVELFPGQTSTLTIENQKRPNLIVYKKDADTGEAVPNTVFLVKAADGHSVDEITTDSEGKAVLSNLLPGVYEVSEKSVPAPWLNDAKPQLVTLYANRDHSVTFENHKKPTLTVNKVDSVTGSPIKGAKFQVWYGSNSTATGELNDLGTFYSDENGQFFVDLLRDGWYKVTELEPAPGFTIKQPATQEFYLKGGTSKTIQFENVPKNAIIVEKYDSVTGEALPGCTFQLKYLGGTSGTGGTVIGTKMTGKNGTAIWAGLNPGAYIVEEIDAADGYSILQASETIMLADSGEQSVVTVRFKNAPDGNLLIRKVCATNPSITLQNAEFKVMYADGTLIGESNGIYRTDENGQIRITGLKPGKSVVVTEVKAPNGFIIDTQAQTIQIKEGKTVTLTYKNQPKGKLIIQKRDSQTGEVLPGAEFRITTAAGCEVGLDGVIGTSTLTQNGIFTTDAQGEIRITNLAPGAYILNEIKAPDGYVIDTPSTNVVIGQGGDTQTVVIKNTKKGGLIIEKYDSVTKQPLSGARFKITTASGELVADNEGLTSSNGLYTTNAEGQIVLSKLLPNTYIVTETKAPDGYRLDPTPQTVVVKAGDTQSLRFYDEPLCSLAILKRDSVTKKPLKGAEFTVKYSDGRDIGKYTTGTDGTAIVTGMQPGTTIVVSESRAPTGYILNETPKHIVVRSGEANSITFDDEPGTTLIIRKFIDGTENEPLSGVAFKVVDGSGAAVGPDDGIYFTDKAGEIVLDGIEPGTTVKVREIKTVDGFVLDGTPQDIKIKGGEVQSLTFWNKRAGTLVIEKRDKVSGELISGAQFQLTYAGGGYVDNDNGHLSSKGLYTTDAKGQIRIDGITGTVVVKEVKAAPGYVIDQSTQTQTVVVNPNDTQTLRFYNVPKQTLTIQKYVEGTTKPIQGVTFLVTSSDGQVIGNSNGEYITDKNGRIVLSNLTPGTTVTVKEIKTPDGYVLDSNPKSIKIKAGEAQTLRFYNQKQGGIIIKKLDSVTRQPLEGVEFQLTYSDGRYLDDNYGHTSSQGLYRTNRNGEIRIFGITGTLIIQETETIPGYVLNKHSQTVKVNADDIQTVTFYNTPLGGVELIKVDAADKSKRLSGAVFEIRKMNDALVDTVTTGKNGRVYVDLDAGSYYALEIEAPKGYKLDKTPHYFKVKNGETTSVTITNKAFSGILIHKTDSATGRALQGVTFLLYDSKNTPIAQATTDNEGYAYFENLTETGRYYLKELDNPGYVPDSQLKTVYVKAGETTLVEWQNIPITAQIQITKKSADYNSVNGLPAGSLLEGAVFEIRDKAGNLVDTIKSDKNGVAASKPLPLGRYVIKETKAPANYSASDKELTAYLEHAGQIVRFEVTNKSVALGVAIKKTGYAEVMPGQNIRYTFSDIGNTSSVPLQSFYWRDTLPIQAVRLHKIITGTYSAPGSYKILYKTNLSNGEYRTMYDNLSTAKSYDLACGPAALGLAANEYVTEFLFEFGVVPAGFHQVEAPKVDCTVLPTVQGGSQFVNHADVGGSYNGRWLQAVTRWATKVYGKPIIPTLPKTGY